MKTVALWDSVRLRNSFTWLLTMKHYQQCENSNRFEFHFRLDSLTNFYTIETNSSYKISTIRGLSKLAENTNIIIMRFFQVQKWKNTRRLFNLRFKVKRFIFEPFYKHFFSYCALHSSDWRLRSLTADEDNCNSEETDSNIPPHHHVKIWNGNDRRSFSDKIEIVHFHQYMLAIRCTDTNCVWSFIRIIKCKKFKFQSTKINWDLLT